MLKYYAEYAKPKRNPKARKKICDGWGLHVEL